MRDMFKTTVPLLIICVIVALCVSVVDYFRTDVMAMRERQNSEIQKKEVLAVADRFEEIKGWQGKASGTDIIKEAYRGISSDKTKGLVFIAYPKGYAGEIKVIIGINSEGFISGVTVGNNKETPGLGSKAAEPAFTGQYSNKSITSQINVVKKKPISKNEIQAISGATISSKAVTNAVNAASKLGKVLLQEEVQGK